VNIKRPHNKHEKSNQTILFLAGTTDHNISGNWQAIVEKELTDFAGVILNPRRDSWFTNEEQTLNNVDFRSQVEWELEGLECADLVLLCLMGGSQSPISLIEFGLTAKEEKLIVYCEKDFWKFGNVEVVCNRYEIPMAKSIDELITLTKDNLLKK